MKNANRISISLIVHEVKVYETGVNISAFHPAGKDQKGEWRVNPWFNIRPVRAVQDFCRTLKPKDRILVEGFIGAYKSKGDDQTRLYIVGMSVTSEGQSEPKCPQHDDDLPF